MFGECRQLCVFEAEKESLEEINSVRKGPGSPCTVISVDFYGKSPESGRLKAIEVLFFSLQVLEHSCPKS